MITVKDEMKQPQPKVASEANFNRKEMTTINYIMLLQVVPASSRKYLHTKAYIIMQYTDYLEKFFSELSFKKKKKKKKMRWLILLHRTQ
jgi:hypothetical protein